MDIKISIIVILLVYSSVTTFILLKNSTSNILTTLKLKSKPKTKGWTYSDWGKLLPTETDNKIL